MPENIKLNEPNELAGLPAVIASLSPRLTVEQAAFEHIHYRYYETKNDSEIIDKFTESLLRQRQTANQSFTLADIALDFAWKLEVHAAGLLAAHPDNHFELDRRVSMWLLTVGLHSEVAKIELGLVKEDWQRKSQVQHDLSKTAVVLAKLLEPTAL